MKKEIRFENVEELGPQNPVKGSVVIEIELEKNKKGNTVLSFSCEKSLKGFDVWQCRNQLIGATSLKYDPTFQKINEWWKNYHLNDMHAGTKLQEETIKMGLRTGELLSKDYDEVCEFLKKKGQYEVMHDDAPYKYGQAWLYEEVPEEILKAITNIPSTVKTCLTKEDRRKEQKRYKELLEQLRTPVPYIKTKNIIGTAAN